MLAGAREWAGAWKKAMAAVLLTGRPHLLEVAAGISEAKSDWAS